MSHRAEPVGGPILTRPFQVLLAILAIGLLLIAWRFVSGLGPTTGMNDGYAWGIWIAYDVVTGTALACGGYAVALLCYVLNQGKYHPMVRPAVLTSALGYTLAGVSIVIDVGRYWNLWKVPLLWNWNRNSILLEVAICVMSYIFVLWLELSPAILEGFERDGRYPLLRRISLKIHPFVNRAMIWILALGILLPTMHHSSLGALMLIAPSKLHPLWHTPLLPLLFLGSCLFMGYAVVVFEGEISSEVFRRPRETKMLVSLSWVMVDVLFVFLALRLGDLAWRGRLGLLLTLDFHTVFFLLEMALFLAPALLMMKRERRYNPGIQFLSAMMMICAGMLYRFDVYMIQFDPGPGWSYFPSVPEMFITFGLVAVEIMVYIFIVKRFPILAGVAPPPSGPSLGAAGVPASGR